MGREVTGIQVVDKKPNGVTAASNGSSNDKVHISPKIEAAKVQAKDHEVKEFYEKKDVLRTKTTNGNAGLPEEEHEKSEVQKMVDNEKLCSPAATKEHTSHPVPQPSDLAAEKHGSYTEIANPEAVATDLNLSPNANNMHSPNSSKDSQVIEVFNSLDYCYVMSFLKLKYEPLKFVTILRT